MAINGKPRKIDYTDWSKPELIREINKLEKRKKYGLIWDEEKTKEIIEEEIQKKLPILNEIKENAILTHLKQPVSILIEGDNYHALSVLNYTSKGQIDVIYIDPPYNTGKEFIYNDKIVDAEDSYKHSKWLSFMNKRLNLAKKLLSNKGIIFISIDDNELAQLKLLCNEIFGDENFLSCIAWQAKDTAGNDAKGIATVHNYLLAYKKSAKFTPNLFPRTEKQKANYKNPDNDPRGPWLPVPLTRGEFRERDYYPLVNPAGEKILPPAGNSWRRPKMEIKKLEDDNRIWWGLKGNSKFPSIKTFLSEVKEGVTPISWWDYKFAGSTRGARAELKELFGGERGFDTPKPVKLIKRILEIASNKNSTVLDFFAGSGTTGHAVLELNKEDGGNRRFILCTNNDNKICTEVCYPRIKKVINGYTNSEKNKIEGLNGNLKYFKTDFVDSESTDQNKRNLVEKSTAMLCLKENCFDLVKEGKQFKIFKNDKDHHLGIIYYYDGIDPFKNEVLHLNKKISTYVFSLNDIVDDEEFQEVDDLVDLKPIPSSILNVYRRIFAYVQTTKLSRKTHK